MPSPRKASPAAHAEAGPMPCSLRVSDTASWAGWELQRPVGRAARGGGCPDGMAANPDARRGPAPHRQPLPKPRHGNAAPSGRNASGTPRAATRSECGSHPHRIRPGVRQPHQGPRAGLRRNVRQPPRDRPLATGARRPLLRPQPQRHGLGHPRHGAPGPPPTATSWPCSRPATSKAGSAPAGVRGKHNEAYRQGTNVVLLEHDVAQVFKDSAAVNRALRAIMQVAQDAELGK